MRTLFDDFTIDRKPGLIMLAITVLSIVAIAYIPHRFVIVHYAAFGIECFCMGVCASIRMRIWVPLGPVFDMVKMDNSGALAPEFHPLQQSESNT